MKKRHTIGPGEDRKALALCMGCWGQASTTLTTDSIPLQVIVLMFYHPNNPDSEVVTMGLNPEDRYQLRKMQMDVDKKALELQKAQQDLERFLLELEHKYGLIGEEKSIDPKTAEVREPVKHKVNGNGKAPPELLEQL